MADFYARRTCRMCNGSELQRVMTLTPTPPGNYYLREEELEVEQPAYPLELNLCGGCGHVQLGHVVDPRILYQKSYTYVSGTSSKFIEHLRCYAAEVTARLQLTSDDLVVDIGSNDGTCLRFFREAGMRIVGVDPAPEIARAANAAGVPTVCDFFSLAVARELRREHGPAALITSHNACAHIDHLDDVFSGVRHWLDDDGVFVLEVGYLLDVYQNAWFDTIYHEHLDYHTVAPFLALCARVGMEPFAVQRVSPQGGSIRVFIQRAGGPRRSDGSLDALIRLERAHGLNRAETFVEFAERIEAIGADLRALLKGLKADEKTIAGYGAPTKATTLMSHFQIGRRELDFIVDDNPLKQGLFSPSAHLPVFEPEELYRRQPDYVLILAWNFATPIMASHSRYHETGGRWILPMPTARVVE